MGRILAYSCRHRLTAVIRCWRHRVQQQAGWLSAAAGLVLRSRQRQQRQVLNAWHQLAIYLAWLRFVADRIQAVHR